MFDLCIGCCWLLQSFCHSDNYFYMVQYVQKHEIKFVISFRTKNWSIQYVLSLKTRIFNPIGAGGTMFPTFFKRLFLHEKRVLDVPNFLTFPNSLWTFRKSKKIIWFFTMFWGDLEGVGWFSPPPLLPSNIQEPRSIRVKDLIYLMHR